MSHFTTLVITETPEQVDAVLQPYHEYECTGIEDEHVVFVDCHDEVVEAWNGSEDYQKTYKTIERFAADYYGYHEVVNGRIGRRTNPNAKWDWWQIGGRWSGFFKPKAGTVGVKGEAGLMGSQRDPMGVDQARKKDIDFESMMKAAADNAAERYDEAAKIIDGRVWESWKACREKYADIDTARKNYNEQPAILDLREWKGKGMEGFFFEPDEFQQTRDEYIHKAKCNSIGSFAVIKDGKWYERGNMGWWGCVSDEKDTWEDDFIKILNEVPDDALLTMVDCHI